MLSSRIFGIRDRRKYAGERRSERIDQNLLNFQAVELAVGNHDEGRRMFPRLFV